MEAPLSDYAESWAKENNIEIPPRDTPEWMDMYQKWIEFAFADFEK